VVGVVTPLSASDDLFSSITPPKGVCLDIRR
jgi:hypothetical protein